MPTGIFLAHSEIINIFTSYVVTLCYGQFMLGTFLCIIVIFLESKGRLVAGVRFIIINSLMVSIVIASVS